MKTFSKIYTRKKICQQIAEAAGLSYNEVSALLELFLEQIKYGVLYQGNVKLRGFGRFYRKSRIMFKPAHKFKKLLKEENDV